MLNILKPFSTWIIIAAIAAALPLFFESSFALTLLSKMGVLIIFTVAYNMLLGQGGMLSFGHAIYFGLAGYASIHILNGIGDNLMEKYFISNPYIETSNAIWATIILIFFGALAGYLPARKAAKIKPIIALRDK